MRWIIDKDIQARAPEAISWAREYLGGFDTSKLDWLRIDSGRDRPGERQPQGIYGRCHWPKKPKGYRISCQVPGPFPCRIRLRLSPLYVTVTRYYGPRPSHVLDEDGSQVMQMGNENGRPFWDVASLPPPSPRSEGRMRNGSAWWTQHGETIVNDLDEGIAWIIGHEAFHFLRRTRQVPGINNEVQADVAGEAALAAYRARAA